MEVFDISVSDKLVRTSLGVPIIDPIDLIIDGNKMFVATKTDFQIFDISDISNIRRIGKIER